MDMVLIPEESEVGSDPLVEHTDKFFCYYLFRVFQGVHSIYGVD